MDLSVSTQPKALRDNASKKDYVIVREFVDEAESGRVMNRLDFQKMIDEAKNADSRNYEQQGDDNE